MLHQEGQSNGVRGPGSAACRKALSGSTFALSGLFPIYSCRLKYFVYFASFSVQLGSHRLLAVNGGGFCHHTMIQYDKSLFPDDSSVRGNKYEMLTNCTSAETSQASTFWFLSVLPRTYTYSLITVSENLPRSCSSFFDRWERETREMKLFAEGPTGSRSRKELWSPTTVWCWAHLPPQRVWRNFASCYLLPHGSLPES